MEKNIQELIDELDKIQKSKDVIDNIITERLNNTYSSPSIWDGVQFRFYKPLIPKVINHLDRMNLSSEGTILIRFNRKAQATIGNQWIAGKWDYGSGNRQYGCWLNNGIIKSELSEDGTSNSRVEISWNNERYGKNIPYFLISRYQSGNFDCWLNKEKQSEVFTQIHTSTEPFIIGALNPNPSNFRDFGGEIDELIIWDRGLSDIEIESLYNESYGQIYGQKTIDISSREIVACVGDSITYGFAYGGQTLKSYPEHLQDLLGPDFFVRNIGSRSSHVGQLLANYNYFVKSHKIDHLIVCIGINDLRGKGDFGLNGNDIWNNLESIFDQARSDGFNLIPCTVPPRKNDIYETWNATIQNEQDILNNLIIEYCCNNNLKYLDFYKSMVYSCEDFALKPEFDSNDGIHPSNKGYFHMAELVKSVI